MTTTYSIIRINPNGSSSISVNLSAKSASEALELYATNGYYEESKHYAFENTIFVAARTDGFSADIAVGKIVPSSAYKVISLHG